MSGIKKILAVIGLGYVGLPLAAEFAKSRAVIGFDVNPARIAELRDGHDSTREVDPGELAAAHHLVLTSDEADLVAADILIVAVPTPIDRAKRPDLTLIERASESAGRALRPGNIVIYESTVFPVCTRNTCVPILEWVSGLRFNEDFFVGYSPERINPGDKAHRLTTIVKVTSGSTPETADEIDALYGSIVTAGTHKAASIEVAEAAKVIENTQRDVNIALMNELAVIFHKLDLDTAEVLAAARTKWNFLPFTPGLVGGHCIGVDPYYLTHRAQEVGHHPEVILSGRRINDAMGRHVADRLARTMMHRAFPVVGSRILVMGLTFKENCPDLRNSRVIDVIEALRDYNAQVDVWDSWADGAEARREFGFDMLTGPPEAGQYDAILLAVPHRDFVAMGAEALRAFGREGAVLFDLKSAFDKSASDGRL
ncbi:nucleotide sugar dehydrogenase [Rhodobacteraceae bacterium ASV31]|nr:nucleotide sugar dehydrogenase [Anianabacter salinae]